MKVSNFPVVLFIIVAISCNTASEKVKDAANKTGEVVAKTGSEFVDGVSKGVEKAFANEVVISDKLKEKGFKTGKIIINSTDSSTDNILTAYLMFEKPFAHLVIVKVFDGQGLEYGRTTNNVIAATGEGKYFDFVFDKRTNIDGKGKISFE